MKYLFLLIGMTTLCFAESYKVYGTNNITVRFNSVEEFEVHRLDLERELDIRDSEVLEMLRSIGRVQYEEMLAKSIASARKSQLICDNSTCTRLSSARDDDSIINEELHKILIESVGLEFDRYELVKVFSTKEDRFTIDFFVESDVAAENIPYKLIGIVDEYVNSQGKFILEKRVNLSTVLIDIDSYGIALGFSVGAIGTFKISGLSSENLSSVCGTYEGLNAGIAASMGFGSFNAKNQDDVLIKGADTTVGVNVKLARTFIRVSCPDEQLR